MKAAIPHRYALNLSVAAALLAACAGSQPPIGAPGAIPPSRAIATNAQDSGSWMLAQAKNGDLLYLADQGSPPTVSVYSFPRLKLVGQLADGYVTGECADAAGNVYIVEANQAFEYAHGGTSPIRTIPNPYYYNASFWSCAVDNNTGNLAIVAAIDLADAYVLIYHNGSGTPSTYTVGRNINPFYCAYDDSSDLFIMTTPVLNYGLIFLELPSGAAKFHHVLVGNPRNVEPLGGVQWLTGRFIFAGNGSVVLRYAFRKSKDRAVPRGQTSVAGSSHIGQFWIQGDTVVVPSAGSNSFNVYKYPSGSEIKTIGGAGDPTAAIVSVAPSR